MSYALISPHSKFIFFVDGTTANTLAFALWELAKNPDLQRRIRKEISHTLHVVQQQGENEIGFGKYDSMDLLTAFLKVIFSNYETQEKY